MKIIEEGDSTRTYPWWSRGAWTCPKCGCKVEFEHDDTHLVKEHTDQRDGDYATASCPTCGHVMMRNESTYQSDQWGR